MPKGVYIRKIENFIGVKNNFYGRKHSSNSKGKISLSLVNQWKLGLRKGTKKIRRSIATEFNKGSIP